MTTNEIILITHADTDHGFATARELLTAGYRVAVTAQHPASLSRILLGQRADRVMAIAANIDDDQHRDAVLQRVRAEFDAPITRIIDGRDAGCHQPLPLQIAS